MDVGLVERLAVDQDLLVAQLERLARERMAALPKARGWDGQRARGDELAFIDAVLDAWNDEVAAEADCGS